MPTLAPAESSIVEVGWQKEAELFAQAAIMAGEMLTERTVECAIDMRFSNDHLEVGGSHSLRDASIRVNGIGLQPWYGFSLRAPRNYQGVEARLTEEPYPDGQDQPMLEVSLRQGKDGMRQVLTEISNDGYTTRKGSQPANPGVIPQWLQTVREKSGLLPEVEGDSSLELVGRGGGMVMVKQESLVPIIASLTRTFGGVLENGGASEINTAGRLNFDVSSSGRIYSGDGQGISLRVQDSAMKRLTEFSLGFRSGVVGPPHAFVEGTLRQEDWSSGQMMATKETLRRKNDDTLEVVLQSQHNHGEITPGGTREVGNDIILEMASKAVALMTRDVEHLPK